MEFFWVSGMGRTCETPLSCAYRGSWVRGDGTGCEGFFILDFSGVEMAEVEFEFFDAFFDVFESAMGVLFLVLNIKLIIKNNFEAGDVEHSVMEFVGEAVEVFIDKQSILRDRIAG